MIQCREDPGFARQAGELIRIAGEPIREDLDGDLAMERGGLGE